MEGFGVPLGTYFGRKNIFWVIFGVHKLESDFVSILDLIFNCFFITFCCFFGVFFTCVAFRVNFANVRFTSVKRTFVRSRDVTNYISFVICRLVSACLFLHAFSNGFGDDFGEDLG